MGSLPLNGNAVSRIVSTTAITTCAISSLFREHSKIRSPVQSPPFPKRILHLPDVGKTAPRHSDGIPDRHSGKRESEAEEEDRRIRARSKPILKKIGSPPGRARRARSKLDPDHRRVDFRPEVVVFRFNRERGEHVGCESQSLNGEPEARNGSGGGGGGTPGLRRQSIGARTTNPLGSPVTTLPGSIATNRNNNNNNNNNNAVVVDGWKNPNAAAAAEAAAAAQVASSQGRHPPSLLAPKNCDGGGDARPLPVLKDSVRFQYFVDDSRNSILQFSLPLGAGTSANDVVVKANRHGDRIRVFGCGGGASGGAPAAAAAGVKCRELCERFALPVRVDSYEISARIDANGVLFVEAPILPNESLKPCLHPVRKAV